MVETTVNNTELNSSDLVPNVELGQPLYIGYSITENPVKDYWDIKLYVYVDTFKDLAFKVKLTNQRSIKLPDGRLLKQFEYIDEVDFEDKEKIIRRKLRKKGIVDDIIYKGIVSYIHYLKSSEKYGFLQDVSKFALKDDKFKIPEKVSIEYYESLIEEIKSSPLSFKISPSESPFNPNEHDGILEEKYKDTGYSALIIEGQILRDILAIEGKTQFEDIIRFWRGNGLLLSGNSGQTRMTTRYTFYSKHRKPSYVIKIAKDLFEFVSCCSS